MKEKYQVDILQAEWYLNTYKVEAESEEEAIEAAINREGEFVDDAEYRGMVMNIKSEVEKVKKGWKKG